MEGLFGKEWRLFWMLKWPLFVGDIEDQRRWAACAEDGGHCSCHDRYPCCKCGEP